LRGGCACDAGSSFLRYVSLRFLYVFVDKDRTGFMTAMQFQEFLEMLHPYEKLR
jgi:hypothetical protein